MTRARLMRDDEEEPRAVPSGVARPKRDRLSEYVHGLFFDRMIKCLIACNAVMALYRPTDARRSDTSSRRRDFSFPPSCSRWFFARSQPSA